MLLGGGSQREPLTIVGVVQNVRQERLRVAPPPRMIYTPIAQIRSRCSASPRRFGPATIRAR